MTSTAVDDRPAALVVRLHNLSKHFGHTRALDGLNLEARGGEILGIAGPNGAGKSTMVGVLAGEVPLDSGEIEIDGAAWQPKLGPQVAVVHQEPQLFGNLTVAENLAVGRERFLIGSVELDAEERGMITTFGLSAVAGSALGTLPLSQRQRVEILRGLLGHAQVVLFDEPNSALAPDESLQLFGEMHRLAASGQVVLLVSHRLHELAEHCDRVAVIRDGRVRTELRGSDITPERIAEELVAGTVLAERTPSPPPEQGIDVLCVEAWSHSRRRFADVSLSVRAGEVVAITGVEGAGGRELVRSLARLEPARGDYSAAGRVEYISGDRGGSLFFNLSVEENLVLRTASSFAGPVGWLRRRASHAAARAATERFDVKAASLADPIGELSGGNQQKVAIAAALLTSPAIVVLEEPTRGVDIGAKADIYAHLRQFADAGGAVVLYCTEESEVFECADRVVNVANGQIVADRAVQDFESVESLAGFLAFSSSGSPFSGSPSEPDVFRE
jgi:ABC-type sugar transport system ATPase subunit